MAYVEPRHGRSENSSQGRRNVVAAGLITVALCGAVLVVLSPSAGVSTAERETLTNAAPARKITLKLAAHLVPKDSHLALELLKAAPTQSLEVLHKMVKHWQNKMVASDDDDSSRGAMLAAVPRSITQALQASGNLCAKKDLIFAKFDQLLTKLGSESFNRNQTDAALAINSDEAMKAWLESESSYRLQQEKKTEAEEGAKFARDRYEKWSQTVKETLRRYDKMVSLVSPLPTISSHLVPLPSSRRPSLPPSGALYLHFSLIFFLPLSPPLSLSPPILTSLLPFSLPPTRLPYLPTSLPPYLPHVFPSVYVSILFLSLTFSLSLSLSPSLSSSLSPSLSPSPDVLRSQSADYGKENQDIADQRLLIKEILRMLGILADQPLDAATSAAGGYAATKAKKTSTLTMAEVKAKITELKKEAVQGGPISLKEVKLLQSKLANFAESDEVKNLLESMLKDLDQRDEVITSALRDTLAELTEHKAKLVDYEKQVVDLSNAADSAAMKASQEDLARHVLNGKKINAAETYKDEHAEYNVVAPPADRSIYVLKVIMAKINEFCTHGTISTAEIR